ncbi:hypothetical protein RYA05_02990 [Pseudomonas syringae pv. actinidiae]|nr:hypothetical protein [Pseudomonas syringae pv. actinidiae]
MQLEAPHHLSIRQYSGLFKMCSERHAKTLLHKINRLKAIGTILVVVTIILSFFGGGAVNLMAASGVFCSSILLLGLLSLSNYSESSESLDARMMENISKIQDYEAGMIVPLPDASNIPLALLKPIYTEFTLDDDFGVCKVSVYAWGDLMLKLSLFSNQNSFISDSNPKQDEIKLFMEGRTTAQ